MQLGLLTDLKIQAACSCKMQGDFHRIKRGYIPKDKLDIKCAFSDILIGLVSGRHPDFYPPKVINIFNITPVYF
jgi:hypothetical protein